MKHLIVGIDTGKTSAVACLDLDGKILSTNTGRFVGIDWFVDAIREVGSPVIIARDKKNPDVLASKLSSIFDAVLFTPSTDISVVKKKILASNRFENFHERDAIAAAKTAFNAYASKLRQVEKLARQNNTEVDRIKAMVIKSYSVHEAMHDKKAGRRLVRRSQI